MKALAPELRTRQAPRVHTIVCLLLLVSTLQAPALARALAPVQTSAAAVVPAADTPSATVLAFYQALAQKRFREAFALTIYSRAVEDLSAAEYEDLRPDFEKMAAGVPEKIELTGEQVSGDQATVFMKFGEDREMKIEPILLVREKGAWIISAQESDRELVKKRGKNFFFEARIEAHHDDVEQMMQRIAAAQFVHASQHGGSFGTLEDLIKAGLVPKDLLGTETTGYRFRVVPGEGGKTYAAYAEPERYNRTGRLSFYLDPHGLRSQDVGGKPFKAPKK